MKLARLGKILRTWNKTIICSLRTTAHIAQEIILRLDQAEQRQLTVPEIELRKLSKHRLLGIAALRRIKI